MKYIPANPVGMYFVYWATSLYYKHMRIIPKTAGFLYKKALKPLFFKQDPEAVHNRILKLGRRFGDSAAMRGLFKAAFNYQHPALQQNIFGLDFTNPVGLSAGFDKDADLINFLPSFGFGFSTVGSITLHPYAGNPPPRLYRLPASEGIVVNYGLKNIGTKLINERIQASRVSTPVVVSIAKTNSQATCDDESGVADYVGSFQQVANQDKVAMAEINISCPNTFGGEPFTTPERLELLLAALDAIPCSKPVVIKMPINLAWPGFQALLDVILRHRVVGVTVGNLNKDRSSDKIHDTIPVGLKGGISGKPTYDLCNELISKTYQYCGDKLIIIGVGGIFSAQDAYEKIKRGASLVELITGMIYEGPQLIGEINAGLVELLEKDGYKNIKEAIGAAYKKTWQVFIDRY